LPLRFVTKTITYTRGGTGNTDGPGKKRKCFRRARKSDGKGEEKVPTCLYELFLVGGNKRTQAPIRGGCDGINGG